MLGAPEIFGEMKNSGKVCCVLAVHVSLTLVRRFACPFNSLQNGLLIGGPLFAFTDLLRDPKYPLMIIQNPFIPTYRSLPGPGIIVDFPGFNSKLSISDKPYTGELPQLIVTSDYFDKAIPNIILTSFREVRYKLLAWRLLIGFITMQFSIFALISGNTRRMNAPYANNFILIFLLCKAVLMCLCLILVIPSNYHFLKCVVVKTDLL